MTDNLYAAHNPHQPRPVIQMPPPPFLAGPALAIAQAKAEEMCKPAKGWGGDFWYFVIAGAVLGWAGACIFGLCYLVYRAWEWVQAVRL